MSKYKCSNCEALFNNKYHYTPHLKKKTNVIKK